MDQTDDEAGPPELLIVEQIAHDAIGDVDRTWQTDRVIDTVLAALHERRWLSSADELAERTDQLHSAHREIARQRFEIKQLRAELAKVDSYRADLAERCARKDLELDELRHP